MDGNATRVGFEQNKKHSQLIGPAMRHHPLDGRLLGIAQLFAAPDTRAGGGAPEMESR